MLTANGRYYTPAEVAQILRVSRPRVYQLLRDRRIRVVRVGQTILVHERDVQRLAREERRPGRPPRVS